jgi:hypothetical protein
VPVGGICGLNECDLSGVGPVQCCLEHIVERRLDSRCIDLLWLEAATDNALDGGGLPTDGDQGPECQINGLAVRRGPSELLRLPEFVLVDVD